MGYNHSLSGDPKLLNNVFIFTLFLVRKNVGGKEEKKMDREKRSKLFG